MTRRTRRPNERRPCENFLGRASAGFRKALETIDVMPTTAAKRKSGRPFAGLTEMVWGRVPVDVKELITTRAEQLGISQSRVVGALLRFALQHEDQVLYPKPASHHENQQELPLNKAS